MTAEPKRPWDEGLEKYLKEPSPWGNLQRPDLVNETELLAELRRVESIAYHQGAHIFDAAARPRCYGVQCNCIGMSQRRLMECQMSGCHCAYRCVQRRGVEHESRVWAGNPLAAGQVDYPCR